MLVAPALVMVRYESVFLIGMVALLLCGRRQVKLAIALVSSATAAVIAYGAVSLFHDAGLLPNSISMKGASWRGVSWQSTEKGIQNFRYTTGKRRTWSQCSQSCASFSSRCGIRGEI